MNREKKQLYIFAGVFLAALCVCGFFFYAVNQAGKNLSFLESAYAELVNNKKTLIAMSEDTKILKKRLEDGKNKNFVGEMEKTASDMGIGKNLKKINFVTKKKEGAFNADDYELKLEGVDINAAVNFIYRISNAGLLVKIKKCSMIISFDNPGLLNINLLVSHVT